MSKTAFTAPASCDSASVAPRIAVSASWRPVIVWTVNQYTNVNAATHPTSTPHSQTNDRRRGFNHGLDTTPVFHHPASVPFVEGSGHH